MTHFYNVFIPSYYIKINFRFSEKIKNFNFKKKHFRYNAFLINYPLGITGELLLIQQKIHNNPEQFYILRFLQVGLLMGFSYLFIYMVNSRRKVFKSIKQE